MNEILTLVLALAAGVLLGAIFFGGLWWTVRKGVSSERPALWFFGSLLLRMSITLAGFYFVARGHWERLLLCLLGFVMARLDRDVADPPPVEHAQLAWHRRPAMRLSPDEMIFWQHGFLKLNGTIVFTWALMLVLAVGSKLITRKLSTDLATFPLAEPLGNRRHRHRETNRRRRPAPAGEVYRLSGHALSVRRRGQPLHRHSRLRAADGLALDHRGARAVRVCGRAVFRHRGAGAGRLPQVLRGADGHHAAVQHHQRTFAHAGPGGPSVRQHDERGDDHRHSADHHALHLSDRHDVRSVCSPAWCRPTSSASWPRFTSRPPRASASPSLNPTQNIEA